MKKTTIILVAIAAIAIVLLNGAIFFVKETEQVLVLQFGEIKQEVTSPGLHIKVPVIQNIRSFEKRILNVDPPAEELLMADQKRLVVDTFARYRIDNMLMYFQTLNTEYAARQRLHTIINAALREVLGKTDLPEILSGARSDLMKQIQARVNEEAERLGVSIVDVRIVHADLPAQVTEATYDRMRSERDREAREARAQGKEIADKITSKAEKERTIILSEAQKDSQIARGEGDKEAIGIYADAFSTDPEFYAFYRSMEAYKKALSDPETTLILSPESDFFRYFDSQQGKR